MRENMWKNIFSRISFSKIFIKLHAFSDLCGLAATHRRINTDSRAHDDEDISTLFL